MKILIDINHPAHVHLFKNFAWEMQKQGNQVLFTTRNKEIAHILLENLGFDYVSFGKHYKKLAGKLWGIIKFDIKLILIALKFKPDVFLSMGSIYASHASVVVRKPHILLQDTENAKFQHKLSIPFAKAILNPVCFTVKFKGNQLFYEGYHELAYLHPNRFTPDKNICKEMGVTDDEPFVILRFVSWNANHDIGHQGFSNENKVRAAKEFSKYAKVFITSETELPGELDQYRIAIPPEKIHNAMAFSRMLFGESSTMASESAVLGVPAIFIDNDGRGYTNEQEEKYDLVFNFTEADDDQERAIQKGIEILKNYKPEEEQKKRAKLLSEKVDVTAFLLWFVNEYPDSVGVMKEKPEFHLKFK